MKILVFGNIGSGKSTVLNSSKKLFPFEVIAIDDFRRNFGDGSRSAELIARQKFFTAIKQNQNQFIECTGIGKVADELFILLQTYTEPIICLTLIAPKEICIKRLKTRIWDIPFPASVEKAFSLLERVEASISNKEIAKLWSSRPNTILLERDNIRPTDITLISYDLKKEIEAQYQSVSPVNDIELMLDKTVQDYYGKEYQTYQKTVIERNDTFLDDRMMISKFLIQANVKGNIVDIGSGNCQWFSLFENTIDHYFAIEANKMALSLAPKSIKLTAININVFANEFKLTNITKTKIDFALFSFFLSHFSDATIHSLFGKLATVNSILIIDSLWNNGHTGKYGTKELRQVKRKISPTESILLPKRFFDHTDITTLLEPFGYSVTKIASGSYWFVCIAQKIYYKNE